MEPGFHGAETSTYSFGPFRFSIAERRLDRDGVSVKLGARAFDILKLLVANAGQAVSKEEIAAQVWSGVFVGESSLRFQIAGLRKALGDDDERRFIATLPGRGYCFVAPVVREVRPLPTIVVAALAPRAARLPPRLSRMVGRQADLATIRALLERYRFVSVVGAGGIGKTTLAVAVAHAMAASFDGNACLVDLGAISDAGLVAGAAAAALGLPVSTADPTADIVAHLGDRSALLVLDSVEHVIAAAATLAERLFLAVPRLHILVTSREALRVEGEQVYGLAPFECPGAPDAGTLGRLLAFPAAQLFVERAAAAGSPLPLDDDDAPVIAGICRRLDGVALAIELAAGRVPAYGLRGTSDLLTDSLRHLQGGRRTALPRQRSLFETLAWSFELLSPAAQSVLLRLAVFVGPFSLAGACAVAATAVVDRATVVEIVADLVAKSLLATRGTDRTARFRLLDTTRAYLLERAPDDPEWAATRRRHAAFYCDLLAKAEHAAPDGSGPAAGEDDLPNVRAALDWCYGPAGDRALGAALAVGASALYLRLSLLAECHRICEAALATLDEGGRGSVLEMTLQARLGQALMYASGNTPRVEQAFERALALTAGHDEPAQQLAIFGELSIFYNRTAQFSKGLSVAERCARVAAASGSAAGLHARLLMGVALHELGRHREAVPHLEAALARTASRDATDLTHRDRARVVLAQSLWLRGLPDQAAALAHAAMSEGTPHHPIAEAVALNGVPSVFLWRGEWAVASAYVDRLAAMAERHSLRLYGMLGAAMKGEIAIRTGHPERGIRMIENAVEVLHAASYELFTTPLMIAVAEGYASLGRGDEALAVIDACLRRVEPDGDLLHLPEVLRVKAAILADRAGEERCAEAVLDRSLAVAREQAALSWELRSAITLARIRERTDRISEARAALLPVYRRFTEGHRTADLRAAAHLLDRLGGGETSL